MAIRSLPFCCSDGFFPDSKQFLQHPLVLSVLSTNLCYFLQLVIPKSCSLGTATWQTGQHPWYFPMTDWSYVLFQSRSLKWFLWRGICGLCSLQWIFTTRKKHCINPSLPSWLLQDFFTPTKKNYSCWGGFMSLYQSSSLSSSKHKLFPHNLFSSLILP